MYQKICLYPHCVGVCLSREEVGAGNGGNGVKVDFTLGINSLGRGYARPLGAWRNRPPTQSSVEATI